MQGINISNVMTQAYKDVSKYTVFFFEGTMPADLQSVPFDPTSLADLRDNCVAMTFNQESKDLVRSAGQTQFGIDARDPHLTIADTPTGFSASNTRVPISWMGYVDENAAAAAGGHATYDPTLAAPDLSTVSTFSGLEAVDEAKDVANNESFRRVGRAGGFTVIDFGSNPKQNYDARLYYYITTSADDLFKDDTVFPYHLNKIQTANPGVYDNTFLFNNETTYYDDHNQQVIQRAYDVDLIAGGTETVTIYMVRNDAYVNQTETPPVSPELVVDTTQGFLEHDIPQQEIALLINGMTMVQRTTWSRQKRPSWAGSNVYYRRCITARIDKWNPDLNEGAGGWEIGSDFDTNTDGLVKEFGTPISATRYIRMYCTYGPIISGYVLVSGDPHWSLANLGFYTKAQDIIYDPADMNVNLSWAIVVPVVDGFDEAQSTVNGSLAYSTKSNIAPVLMCDVGETGSGAAIEVTETNFMSQARPRITQMNFVFND